MIHGKLYSNATTTSGDTSVLEIHNYDMIEIYGDFSSGSTTVFFDRSTDGDDYYETDSIILTSGQSIFARIECISRYARIRFASTVTGLTLYYSAK